MLSIVLFVPHLLLLLQQPTFHVVCCIEPFP